MFETITVCIMCGNKIVDRSLRNPNLCLSCCEHDWHETQDMLQELRRETQFIDLLLKPKPTAGEHNRFPHGRWRE